MSVVKRALNDCVETRRAIERFERLQRVGWFVLFASLILVLALMMHAQTITLEMLLDQQASEPVELSAEEAVAFVNEVAVSGFPVELNCECKCTKEEALKK